MNIFRHMGTMPVTYIKMLSIGMSMRLLLLLLFVSFPAFAEYEFEKSKFQKGKVCNELVGTWYTDVYASKHERHITRIERKNDGTALLKGLTLDYKTGESFTWDFPSDWSCSNGWYVEQNEWGFTAFEVLNTGAENVLKDTRMNLNSEKVIEIVEVKALGKQKK